MKETGEKIIPHRQSPESYKKFGYTLQVSPESHKQVRKHLAVVSRKP
jgi:hypothetical protein